MIHPDFGESFKSSAGAVEEARWVYFDPFFFWRKRLDCLKESPLKVLEIGFGLGSVAGVWFEQHWTETEYTSIENDPKVLGWKEESHETRFAPKTLGLLEKIRTDHEITVGKLKAKLVIGDATQIHRIAKARFDVVLFDPFSPRSSPGLWTRETFENLTSVVSPKAVLITYSSSNPFRQTLESLGWKICRLEGLYPKREITAALWGCDFR